MTAARRWPAASQSCPAIRSVLPRRPNGGEGPTRASACTQRPALLQADDRRRDHHQPAVAFSGSPPLANLMDASPVRRSAGSSSRCRIAAFRLPSSPTSPADPMAKMCVGLDRVVQWIVRPRKEAGQDTRAGSTGRGEACGVEGRCGPRRRHEATGRRS